MHVHADSGWPLAFFENPRVGGSIPPQATSVYAPQRPIRVLGRFYNFGANFYKRLEMEPLAELSSVTVRIVAFAGADAISVGTGFSYGVALTEGQPIEATTEYIPLIVTNKHVLEGADTVEIVVTHAPVNAQTGAFGVAAGSVHERFRLPLAVRIDHPSADVDLCGFNIAGLHNHLHGNQRQIVQRTLTPETRVATADRQHVRHVNNVLMVGYPSGLWDHVNNAPIVRRGITATHPFVGYEGRSEFLIDAACFPGSSGSPVFLFEDGTISAPNNSVTFGTRIAFLGVLYAGPQFTAEGVIQPRPIPHSVRPVPITEIPMNLGFVINADEVEVLARAARQQRANEVALHAPQP
jgi:hypothetical protein